jgi:uncharacterized protein (DUF2267 family)
MIAERGIPFSDTVEEMDAWLDDVAAEMGGVSYPMALRALSGVLAAFRDTLPVAAALNVGSRLPAVLRSLYFQGYRPDERPASIGRRQFLGRIRYELRAGTELDAELAASAVMIVLERRLGDAEIQAITRLMPPDARAPQTRAPLSA